MKPIKVPNSARFYECVEMFEKGLGNKKIAEVSGLTVSTVATYRSVARKMDDSKIPDRREVFDPRNHQRILRDGSISTNEAAELIGVSQKTISDKRQEMSEKGVFVSHGSKVKTGRFFSSENLLTLYMCQQCDTDLVSDGHSRGVRRFVCPACGKKMSATAVLDDIAKQFDYNDWRSLSVAIAHGECAVSIRSAKNLKE